VVTVRLTEWKHVPCFAHNLNLILQYVLQGMEDLHTKVGSVVEFSRSSLRASIALKAIQQQLGEPALTLKQDVVTRSLTCDTLRRSPGVKSHSCQKNHRLF
jgi:hypothetical protein